MKPIKQAAYFQISKKKLWKAKSKEVLGGQTLSRQEIRILNVEMKQNTSSLPCISDRSNPMFALLYAPVEILVSDIQNLGGVRSAR